MLLEFSSYRDLIVLELFVNWAENDLTQLFCQEAITWSLVFVK